MPTIDREAAIELLDVQPARVVAMTAKDGTPFGFEPGPPRAPLRASLYWKLAQGLVHLHRVAVAGDGSLVCRELDVGGGFQPLASLRWDAHAPCTPPGPWSLAFDGAAAREALANALVTLAAGEVSGG